MNFSQRYSSATIVSALRIAALGAVCFAAGSVGVLLILNLIVPDRPFLVGFAGAGLISVFVAFPLLLILQLKVGELKKLQETVNYTARHDSVTKTLNGTAFAAAVEHYIDRRKRIATDAGGVMIAVVIDTLDEISRRYGPQWADTVMQSLAAIIQSSVRKGDLVARLATNELGVFLPGATVENAQDVGTRIRRRVAEASFSAEGTPMTIGVRLGGAVFEGPTDFNHIRQLADEMAMQRGGENEDAIPLSRLPAA
ncbi:GGDEF domain-containing protein [Rhizobium mesoamericanum]|uniref:diguanylate cyclase n=1 Tax=Rhizobium mesoamericanum STM3625 TaxID=1211777 RepID=K0PLI1_9HYPH|nr:GGDEF domain-containing protein [Rhizobium mesoamericanum]CCM74778.1 putative Diguanylate cyclase [Rhizobium mesoamericanum STM3625]